jgi:dUTP pyrophosphatase
MTAHSAGADLLAREEMVIGAGERGKVATGVWIAEINWDSVPDGFIPELQIRARSGLAFKYGVMLTNGVGTIDADYRDEICVLLFNSGKEAFTIKRGDRIAQMVLNLVPRLSCLETTTSARSGGFGSTGKS